MLRLGTSLVSGFGRVRFRGRLGEARNLKFFWSGGIDHRSARTVRVKLGSTSTASATSRAGPPTCADSSHVGSPLSFAEKPAIWGARNRVGCLTENFKTRSGRRSSRFDVPRERDVFWPNRNCSSFVLHLAAGQLCSGTTLLLYDSS